MIINAGDVPELITTPTYCVRNLGALFRIQSGPSFLSLFLAPRRAGSQAIFGSTGIFLYRLFEIWFARLMCFLKFSGTKSVTNRDALYGETEETRSYDARSNEREIREASVKFDQIARGLIRYNFTQLCALIFLTHLALIPASWLLRESQHNLSLKQKRTRITSKGIPLTSLVGLMLLTS